MATLFVLESGISQASEETKKWFTERPFDSFFCKMNPDGTATFICSTNSKDRLTTSLIKEIVRADNGYMKIITQNSVIHITPQVKTPYLEYELSNIISEFKMKGIECTLANIGEEICTEYAFYGVTKYFNSPNGIISHMQGVDRETNEPIEDIREYPIKLACWYSRYHIIRNPSS